MIRPAISPLWCTLVDVIRTTGRQTALDLYSLFPDETRECVEKVVTENEAQGMKLPTRPNSNRKFPMQLKPNY